MTSGSSELLRYEEEGPIRILTLNDPDKRNPMTDPLHEAFTDVWVRIMRDHDARAVVLTGAGPAFSASGNIPGFVRNVEDVDYRRASMRNARLLVDHILRVPPARDCRGQRSRSRPRLQHRGFL
jgi:enoyl-CoA hydratase